MSSSPNGPLQAPFPETSRTRYLTGIAALNIPAPENTGGDWHFLDTFRSPDFPSNLDLAGDGLEWNTNPVFGDYGIHECSKTLKEDGGLEIPQGTLVFSANHYRAILDMLYRDFSKGTVPATLPIEDWLDTEEQRQTLYRLLDQFLPWFPSAERMVAVNWEKSRK